MTDQITNAEDVIDSRDIIARIEELEAMSMPWVAGWNMPGYMPDNEPAAFATWDEARDYLVEELERFASEAEEHVEELEATAKELAKETHKASLGFTVGNYHYFVAVAHEDGLSEEEREELETLKDLAEEAAQYAPDWEYGETLIRDSYFKDYAQELAEDIGAINANASWPNNCIDWDQAARELRMDYSSVEFDGVTYWVR